MSYFIEKLKLAKSEPDLTVKVWKLSSQNDEQSDKQPQSKVKDENSEMIVLQANEIDKLSYRKLQNLVIHYVDGGHAKSLRQLSELFHSKVADSRLINILAVAQRYVKKDGTRRYVGYVDNRGFPFKTQVQKVEYWSDDPSKEGSKQIPKGRYLRQ